jgi:hypothetical protein
VQKTGLLLSLSSRRRRVKGCGAGSGVDAESLNMLGLGKKTFHKNLCLVTVYAQLYTFLTFQALLDTSQDSRESSSLRQLPLRVLPYVCGAKKRPD